MKPLQACLIICGEKHLDVLLHLLDEVGVSTWAVVAACQSRNLSFLQNVPGRHPAQPYLVVGMASAQVMDEVQHRIEDGRQQSELDAECLAYAWDLHPVISPQVALDPVCDEVVNCSTAPSASFRDHTYYFASDTNRDVFLEDPDQYVELRKTRRLGRRNWVPTRRPNSVSTQLR